MKKNIGSSLRILLTKSTFQLLIFFIGFFSLGNANAQSTNCTTATQVTLVAGAACVNGTSAGALSDNTMYGACNAVPVNEVWYTYVTNGSANTFTITPTTLTNAEIIIYTGNCPSAGGTLQSCHTVTGSTALNYSWGLPANTQVWIGIASNAGTDGSFQFCVNSQPSAPGPGNTCSQAVPVCTMPFNQATMPNNVSGQTPTCFTNPVQQDIWIQFTVTTSGNLAWTATPNSPGTEFDWCLWDISAGCPGTIVCCNYNFAGGSVNGFGMQNVTNKKACGTNGAAISANAEFCAPTAVTCGKTYAIQVSNFDSDNSGFSLALTNSTCQITSNAAFSVAPTLFCGASLTTAITNTSTGDCAAVWSYGDGSATYTGTAPPNHTYNTPGTYAITETIGGACASSATHYVDLYAPLAATAIATPSNCAPCNGTASVNSVSGGDGVYTYSWNTGPTSSSLTGLCPGSYTVTVSNAKCGSTVTQTVTVNPSSPPTASVAAPAQITCSSPTIVLNGSASSSGANIAYNWTTTGGTIASGGATNSATVSAAGTYTLTVTNTTTNCTATASVTVTTNTVLPTANAGAPQTLTCAITTVTLNGTGSSAGMNYAWTGPTAGTPAGTTPTTTSTNVTAAGTYTITVTNPANGCTKTATVVVSTNITPPTANAGAPQTLTCAVTTVTLDGTSSSAGMNYAWTGPTAGTPAGTTPTATTTDVSSTGTYTLTVTNPANGCSATSTVVVNPSVGVPTANAGTPQTLTCTTTTVTLNGTGSSAGMNYAWTGPTAGTPAGTTPTATSTNVTSAGTYTITVTNPANGCTSTSTVVVSLNNTIPAANAGTPQTLTCIVTTVTLNGTASSAGMNYAWTGPTAGTPAGTTPTATSTNVTVAGTYTITVTNPANGCSNTSTVVVSLNNTIPTANAGPPQTLTCTVTTVTLDGTSSSAGMNYAWTGPTAGTPAGTTPTATSTNVTAAGTYTITVADPTNGCSNTNTVVVSLNNTIPTANAGSPQTLTCAVTTVTLDGSASSAGMNYAWTGPTAGTPAGTTPIATSTDITTAGTYTITVIDPTNGCTNTGTVIVGVNNTPPSANAGAPQTITCTITTVTLDGSASSAGMTYAWTGPTAGTPAGTTPTATTTDVSSTGTYTLTVTNPVNGCSAISTVIVNPSIGTPVASAGPSQTLNCTVTTVTLDGSASSAGMTYAWTGPTAGTPAGTTPTAASTDVTAAGTYTITVIDPTNGCTNTSTVVVSLNNTPPISNAGPPQTLTCSVTTLTLDGSASSAGMAYAWVGPSAGTPAGTTPTAITTDINSTGTYTLTVLDPTNGCFATSTVIVSPSIGTPTANAGPAQTITCTTTTVTLDGTGSSAGMNYAWTGPTAGTPAGTTPAITTTDVTTAGTYTITVTDPTNGCINTSTVVVSLNNTIPTANAGTPQTLTCATTTVTLNGNTSSAGMTYAWTGPTAGTPAGTTPTATTTDVTVAGTYTLTVSNPVNGCTNTGIVIVSLNNTIPTANAGTPQTLTCTTTTVTLDGSGSSTGMTYAWTGPTAGTPAGTTPTNTSTNVTTAGTYTITVANPVNGCINTATVVISANNTPPIAAASSNGPVCANLTLNLFATTFAGASYSWTGPNAFTSIQQNPSISSVTTAATGNYILTVTDPSNGCTATSTVSVVINSLPVITVNAPSVCVNQTINLISNSNPAGTSYSWSGPNAYTASIQDPSINNATMAMSGTYTVSITDINGCVNASVAIVTVNQLPIPVVGNNGPICENKTLMLASSGGASYSWTGPNSFTSAAQNPNITNVSPAAGGTYSVVVTDIHNCQATATTTVTINPLPVITLSPQISGCVPACGNFGITSVPASTTCSFNMGDGNTVSGNDTVYSYCYQTPGIYGITVTASDANGCQSTTPFNGWVNAFNLPHADFSFGPQPTTIFDPEITFINQSTGGPISINKWSFGDSLFSTSTLPDPSFTYVFPGTYSVQLIVTNTKGCIDTTVGYVTIDDDFSIYVPNAFSPNGDHLNDTFYPKGNGIDPTHYQLWVFDRWGNEIFYSNDVTKQWDGKIRGEGDIVMQDVYVWKLKVKSTTGNSKQMVGRVSVIR